MAEYHVTTFAPGEGRAVEAPPARRVDTAGARFVEAVQNVLHGLSLRDTQGGWNAYRAACAAAMTLRAGAVSARLDVSGYVVLVERVA
ncbi:hypothetical protein [Methylobacterium brachiatum]|uniref:hypothetical protein n=1 Tax=Methylobacterium brachiatum TaxID=269660 RepID=UPI0008E1226B|nr:hypothetical protein [Methylobacterium brachiatum]SFI05398.1 hypothetical protein SAMN02799642_00557 [Methylobacterium brachiatum]